MINWFEKIDMTNVEEMEEQVQARLARIKELERFLCYAGTGRYREDKDTIYRYNKECYELQANIRNLAAQTKSEE